MVRVLVGNFRKSKQKRIDKKTHSNDRYRGSCILLWDASKQTTKKASKQASRPESQQTRTPKGCYSQRDMNNI